MINEVARRSAVRSHREFVGLRGDVDRRCGNKIKINIYESGGGEDGQGGVAKDVEVAAAVPAAVGNGGTGT